MQTVTLHFSGSKNVGKLQLTPWIHSFSSSGSWLAKFIPLFILFDTLAKLFFQFRLLWSGIGVSGKPPAMISNKLF